MKAALRRAFMGLPLLFCLALPAHAAPAMWRVSDADSSIHLFGSIHMFVRDVDWRTPEFDRALAEADLVYFEMVFDEAAYATIGRMTLVEGRLRDGRTLWDLLTGDQAETVRRAIATAGLDPLAFDSMQPWMAELLLSGGTVQDAKAGVELQVDAEVPAERKRGLESAEEQMGFFASVDEADQIANLVSTAEQLSMVDGRELIEQLTDVWASGDVGALDFLNREELGGGDARYDLLITRRNERWIDELEALLANNDNAMVIVGAGHLVGDGGVPELLKQAGYTVERVGDLPAAKPMIAPDPRSVRPR
jgi:uncharacterized protein YbaP (TraB family)